MADLVRATLCEDLLAVFDDPSYRPPPLPEVAIQLLSLSGREDANVGQVVSLLERDVMLAGTVLRLVGSPMYAGRSPIRSLREAVVRLGLHGIRDAVFEASLKNHGVFSLREYADVMTAVARHSTVTAYITRIVCRRAGMDADRAFICGLLHDVGFAGLMLAVEHMDRDAAPPLALLWRDVDAIHERASLLLVERWGLPADVVEVVGHHHHLHTGDLGRLAAAVRLADHLSRRFGAVVLGPVVNQEPLIADLTSAFDLELAYAELGIDEAATELIVREAERTVPEILWL